MRLLHLAILTLLCTCARAQTCQVLGNLQPYTPAEILAANNNTDTLLPEVYMELDYDYVDHFPSPAAAELEFRAAFAEVVKRYEVDATIAPKLELFIHTQPSGYVATSSYNALFEFRDARINHPADVKQLISFRGSGGIAFLDQACRNYGFSYSSVQPFHAPYTSYSWTVLVIGHELGHVFGAQHTQACAYNGNNTPLDGCFEPEGECERPELPATGSMMSYCHLQGTVQNSTRILPQVAGVMRARLLAAGCIERRPAVDEPEPCTEYETIVEINTDLHPRETTWAITNGVGETIAQGGPYPKSEFLTTFYDTLCLPAGCYDFTAYDAAGDGLFDDRYGYGSASVRNADQSMVYVEAFTDTITQTFCLGDEEPEICDYLSLDSLRSYGTNQDNGTVVTNGTSATLTGNAWKALHGEWEITDATIIDVEVKAGPVGEILGIGFDDNEVISSNRTFRLGGAQAWGLNNYAVYPQQGGGWYRVSIPVGQFYTGTFSRLFLVNDNDALPVNNVATFKNLRVHNGQCGPALPVQLGANAGAKQGTQKKGYYFDTDSPYLLSDLSGRVILRGHARQGSTVRLSDVNAPFGVYVFSWNTSEGPMAKKVFVGPGL